MSQIQRRARRIGKLIEEAAGARVRECLTLAADISGKLDVPVYLIGGAVRDLLLTGRLRDLDLAVEGSSADFAQLLGERLDAPIRLHPRFLTAEVEDPLGPRIDIASCRAESYPEPAALPLVRAGTLEEDLDRRDFSINTLAIRLGPEPGFELIDSKGGLQDLEGSRLRILHPQSFVDDPTRAFRAIRLEGRLGLRLDSESERLLRQAIENGVVDRLSGSRLRHEVSQTFAEIGGAEDSLGRLEELGLLGTLHPRLGFEEQDAERLARVLQEFLRLQERGLELPALELWRLTLMAVAWRLGPAEGEELVDRLLLAGSERELLLGVREQLARTASDLSRTGVSPHVAARSLARLADEELVLLAGLCGEEAKSWVVRWLGELCHIELTIAGGDLLARGALPGPAIGAALDATLDARFDGVIGADEELSYAIEFLEKGEQE